jgi:hypothetical protein
MISDEYVIGTKSGEDYPFDIRGLEYFVIPDGFDVKVVPPAYGQLGLVINGIEFSFAIEPPGIQTAIEDGEPTEKELDEIFVAIIQKLKDTTGLDGIYYPL